ncbi:MAG TPA: CHASE2 domain-containing protein, partial [Spirochaetota bacterium]|nr:CHASE2 domain-containing protein [Spirochaetota bacterium]
MIVFVFFFCINFISVFLPQLFNIWNLKINDNLMNLRLKVKGNEPVSPFITHIDLNDTSIETHNISMFDRKVYGDIVTILTKLNVKYIAFDILFTEKKDIISDNYLVSAFKQSNSIYMPVNTQNEQNRDVLKLPNLSKEEDDELTKTLWFPKIIKDGNPFIAKYFILNFIELFKSSKGVGHINIDPDEDGVYRRTSLLIKYKNGYIPLLSFKVICDYLKVTDKDIEIYFGKYIKLKNAKLSNNFSKDIIIPIDDKGRMIINFAGRWNKTYFHTSFENVLSSKDDEEKLEMLKDYLDKSIVIISDVTSRGKDHGTIPIEKVYPLSGLHSNIINSILKENFIYNPDKYQIIFLIFVISIIYIILAIKLKTLKFAIVSFIYFIMVNFTFVILYIFFNIQIINIEMSISFVLTYIILILFKYIIEQKNQI